MARNTLSKNALFEAELDIGTMDPNRLRDLMLNSLSVLSPGEKADARDKILFGLRDAGVDLGGSLLMLGIPARSAEELTPPDLAMLTRYVRINSPGALDAISEFITDLTRRGAKRGLEFTRKAA